MRKPETVEKLYLDLDGFFASVMQQAMPRLRGKPVGVIPFETSAAQSTIIIACSREAKAAGCTNIMGVPEVRRDKHQKVLIYCTAPIVRTVEPTYEIEWRFFRARVRHAWWIGSHGERKSPQFHEIPSPVIFTAG